jgi:hypothetical protein
MFRAGFEPATPATKRPQTYALDRAAAGIDLKKHYCMELLPSSVSKCGKRYIVWSYVKEDPR